MKITRITQQQKRTNRYSVFVDGVYSFSLSEAALISSQVTRGQELSQTQLGELKRLSTDDKLYNKACRYVAIRPHTAWEVSCYLERQQASPALIDEILNKLSNIGLVDDAQYAKAYVHDRQLLRPTSRRKIMFELRKKHVAGDIIEAVLQANEGTDQTTLQTLVERKRQQSRYQDDLKLMQYLARQGYHYSDIKAVMKSSEITP
jgi:regulatory protein